MPSLLVEILYTNRESTFKKCKIQENMIIIEKPKKGRGHAGWRPRFTPDCIIEPYKTFLRFWKRKQQKKVMVLDGAQECISFKNPSNPELNGLTRTHINEFAELEVIKRSGDVKIKHEFPFIVWLFGIGAFGSLIMLVFMIWKMGLI